MDKEIERLIHSYGNEVLKIAYIYLKDKHLAEDIFQEVFVKVYKNYGKFRGKSSEKTWILTITINTCKDALRSSWFKKVFMFTGAEKHTIDDLPSAEALEDNVIKQMQHKQLLTHIMNLPSKYKEIILLYYYEHMSTFEISKILKIPEGTVRSRLFRAREILKYDIDGKIEYEG